MNPAITRETIVDRRQPAIRWTAVFAGSAIAVGLWGVLQLLGVGVGLVAIDPHDTSSLRPAALGTTAFSTLAPLVAMFVGGYIATKLASTYDRRVATTHGLVTWGIASVIGLVSTVLVFSALGHGASENLGYYYEGAYSEPAVDVEAGEPAPVVDPTPVRTVVTTPEQAVMRDMENAGKGLVALALAMLLSIVTALAGALVAMRGDERDRAMRPHTTAPYPVQPEP